MELDKVVFYDPYFSLFDELLTRLEPEAVGCIGHTILLELLDMQMT